MIEDSECKLCLKRRLQAAFQKKQWQRAQNGKLASCATCQEAIIDLKREAAMVRSKHEGVDTGIGFLLEEVTDDTMCFWEEALLRMDEIDENDSECQDFRAEMLQRWLDEELAAQQPSSAIVHATPCEIVVPQWLNEVRQERIWQYDTIAFPFEQLFCGMFQTSNLAHLHKQELTAEAPLCPTLLRAYHLAGIKRPKTWRQREKWPKRHVKLFRNSAHYAHFIATYQAFIKKVVLPLVGHGDHVMFQCPPTLRCHMPSTVTMGKPHRDSDFSAHHGCEINFWIPVTQVWGANTLHVESQPDKEDFRPLELGSGEAVVFNGSKCLHYTVPNTTDSARVSFDFRVIPESLVGTWRHTVKSGTTSELAQYDFISTRDLQ